MASLKDPWGLKKSLEVLPAEQKVPFMLVTLFSTAVVPSLETAILVCAVGIAKFLLLMTGTHGCYHD